MRQHLNKLETDSLIDSQTLSFFQKRLGQDRSGLERTGQDRSGKVRTSQDRSGQVRRCWDRSVDIGKGLYRSGRVGTGREGLYRLRQVRMG